MTIAEIETLMNVAYDHWQHCRKAEQKAWEVFRGVERMLADARDERFKEKEAKRLEADEVLR